MLHKHAFIKKSEHPIVCWTFNTAGFCWRGACLHETVRVKQKGMIKEEFRRGGGVLALYVEAKVTGILFLIISNVCV